MKSLKKYFLFVFILSFFFLVFLSFSGCQSSAEKNTGESLSYSVYEKNDSVKKQSLKILSWNVETFFDPVKQGSEYKDFSTSKNWDKEKYTARLERLCSSIKSLNADVLVLCEIENEGVLHDISNFLAGEWRHSKIYSYGAFASQKGSALGCAVMSRYPVLSLKTHGLQVVRDNVSQPSMRPIMEVEIKKGSGVLTLFANHWKSMSGGEDETQIWRDWQQKVLAERLREIEKEGKPYLVCGDFNQDVKKFVSSENNECLLIQDTIGDWGYGTFYREDEKACVEVKCGWKNSDGSLEEPGSYCYNGNWSRIDNMFTGGGALMKNFRVETEGNWCDPESFVPRSYEVWSGTGYSDHLPLSCLVTF